MARLILRIIVSKQHEVKYVRTTLMEALDVVDVIILTISRAAHTGGKVKDPVNIQDLTEGIPESKTILRIHEVLPDRPELVSTKDAKLVEKFIRRAFLGVFSIRPWDRIIGLDADEVIFRDALVLLRSQIRTSWIPLRLRLFQFMYFPDVLWRDFYFKGPVVTPGWMTLFSFISIRDLGIQELRTPVGAHFSWQMELEGMMDKMLEYAHRDDFQEFRNRDLLQAAVKNLEYPFEPERKVTLTRLKRQELASIIPPGIIDKSEIYGMEA